MTKKTAKEMKTEPTQVEVTKEPKMDIILTRKYRLTADSNQYILQEKAESESGREYRNNIGYYTNLEYLIKSITEKAIKTKKVDELKELNTLVKNMSKEIGTQLEENVRLLKEQNELLKTKD